MSVPEIAAVEPAPATPPESPIGAIAIPIGVLSILLSFLAVFGVFVSLIPSALSLTLGIVGVVRARRRGTSSTWAIVAIAFAVASFLACVGLWALPHLIQLVADQWSPFER